MPQKNGKPNIALIIFCLIMCLGAVGAEIYTVHFFLTAIRVNSWPTADATITRSELESEFLGKMQYTAQIEYSFSVGGKNYSSSKVRTRGTSNRHKTDIMAVLEKFPLGAKAPVYYNPLDPNESYLEASGDIVNWIIIISPIVFALLFGIAFVELIRKRRPAVV